MAGVKPDQLDGPTPRPDWDVRALRNHAIGGVSLFRAAAGGKPVGTPDGDPAGDDVAGAFAQAAAGCGPPWPSPACSTTTGPCPSAPRPANKPLAWPSWRCSSTAGTWPGPPGRRSSTTPRWWRPPARPPRPGSGPASP
ncbi:MAG: hypothetical protein ACRD0M_03285 [Acidimicrobiales bacterium]